MKPRNMIKKYYNAAQAGYARVSAIVTSLFASLLFMFGLSAHAAVDVAAVVTEIGLVQAAAVLIGIAILTMAVSVKAYRWLKAAL